MAEFCIHFPETVSGETLEDQFREYAREGTNTEFNVSITDNKVLDYETIVEKAKDSETASELQSRNEQDRKKQHSILSPSSYTSEAAGWMLEYKPGIEVTVQKKRTSSWKNIFAPLTTTFRIAPDEDYRSLNETSQRIYEDAHVQEFESFAGQLIKDLDLPYDGEAVTEDIPKHDDADYNLLKSSTIRR